MISIFNQFINPYKSRYALFFATLYYLNSQGYVYCVVCLHMYVCIDAHVWINLVLGADRSYNKTAELLVVQIQENLPQTLENYMYFMYFQGH